MAASAPQLVQRPHWNTSSSYPDRLPWCLLVAEHALVDRRSHRELSRGMNRRSDPSLPAGQSYEGPGPGYLYVLINPSLPGLVKIGKTNRDPEQRAAELSAATGVPTPFVLVYDAFFQNCS